MKSKLSGRKCVPCEGGIPSMILEHAREFLKELNGWKITGGHLIKEMKFKNFKETIKFVNKVADLAEREGHHPDLFISYSRLKIELWTHAMNGLSENDFILAAKIDDIKN